MPWDIPVKYAPGLFSILESMSQELNPSVAEQVQRRAPTVTIFERVAENMATTTEFYMYSFQNAHNLELTDLKKGDQVLNQNFHEIAFFGYVLYVSYARSRGPLMLRTLSLLCALAPAYCTIELTPDTFNKEVFESGKSAFIKFLAPW